MSKQSSIPQVEVRLELRDQGDLPFDTLPDSVELVEKVDVSAVPDSEGALILFRVDVQPGALAADQTTAVITPMRISVLEAVVAACGSLYAPRPTPGLHLLDRKALAAIVRSQASEIDRLRTIISNRAKWIFRDEQ